MNLVNKEYQSELTFPSEGTHLARCYAVIDLGKPNNANTQFNNTIVMLGWELPEELHVNGSPKTIFQRYNASLNENSKLRWLLEDWRNLLSHNRT